MHSYNRNIPVCWTLNKRIFSLLYGAFCLLLGCYANQKAITMGIPSANRNQPELENLIGFFVNMLVLNILIEPNQLFTKYFEKISAEIIGAQSNPIPFEKLVKSLDIEKDVSRHPIFQVVFNLVNSYFMDEKNLLFAPYDPPSYQKFIKSTARFDIEISIYHTRQCILGNCIFYTKIFHRETVQSFLSTYKTILNQLAEFLENKNIPKMGLKEIKWVDSTQEKKLTLLKNEKRLEPLSHLTLPELFESVAKEFPSKTAVECGERNLTYHKLNEYSNQLANHLRHSVRTHTKLAP